MIDFNLLLLITELCCCLDEIQKSKESVEAGKIPHIMFPANHISTMKKVKNANTPVCPEEHMTRRMFPHTAPTRLWV